MPNEINSIDIPIALTIAGSDSGGGAGIQADLKTFQELDVFGTSAITCLTAQNPDSIESIVPLQPEFVLEQLNQVINYFPVKSLKTGMLYNNEIIKCVADFLVTKPEIKTVVDPVMVATSGASLLQNAAIETIKESLLPTATIITPNLDEAEILLGKRPCDKDSMIDVAIILSKKYQCAVLVKGGHLESTKIFDVLVESNEQTTVFQLDKIDNINTHGSGCRLSSAIAAYLALDNDILSSVKLAHNYIQKNMRNPVRINDMFFLK